MTEASFNYMNSDDVPNQRLNQERQTNTQVSRSDAALPYKQQLEQNFERLIEELDLEKRQKLFLKHRWLEQVLWMEDKSNVCRDRHVRLKLTAIVLSVITPILITASTQLSSQQKWDNWIKGTTIAISSVVAVAASVDEFFNYGKRWYGYRQAVESMKSEGWQFFQLTGSYQTYKGHDQAFSVFANQVEEIIRRDVNLFVTQQQSQQEEHNQPSANSAS